MGAIRNRLIAEACRHYTAIYPCGTRTRIEDCFTRHGTLLLFWFNTADGTTRLMHIDCSELTLSKGGKG